MICEHLERAVLITGRGPEHQEQVTPASQPCPGRFQLSTTNHLGDTPKLWATRHIHICPLSLRPVLPRASLCRLEALGSKSSSSTGIEEEPWPADQGVPRFRWDFSKALDLGLVSMWRNEGWIIRVRQVRLLCPVSVSPVGIFLKAAPGL